MDLLMGSVWFPLSLAALSHLWFLHHQASALQTVQVWHLLFQLFEPSHQGLSLWKKMLCLFNLNILDKKTSVTLIWSHKIATIFSYFDLPETKPTEKYNEILRKNFTTHKHPSLSWNPLTPTLKTFFFCLPPSWKWAFVLFVNTIK